jgi:hypothetical protein
MYGEKLPRTHGMVDQEDSQRAGPTSDVGIAVCLLLRHDMDDR